MQIDGMKFEVLAVYPAKDDRGPQVDFAFEPSGLVPVRLVRSYQKDGKYVNVETGEVEGARVIRVRGAWLNHGKDGRDYVMPSHVAIPFNLSRALGEVARQMLSSRSTAA